MKKEQEHYEALSARNLKDFNVNIHCKRDMSGIQLSFFLDST